MSRTGFFLVAVTALAITPATPVLADDDRTLSEDMTEQAISQIVTYAGYDVVDIDRDGHVYVVQAYKPEGQKVRLQVLAEDGSILPTGDQPDAAVAVRD